MAKHLRHRLLRKKIDWQNMPSMSPGNVVLRDIEHKNLFRHGKNPTL